MSSQKAPSTIGERVRVARIAAGLSQRALSLKAGLASSHVGTIERGRVKSLDPHTVAVLAAALGVGIPWLAAGIVDADGTATGSEESTRALLAAAAGAADSTSRSARRSPREGPLGYRAGSAFRGALRYLLTRRSPESLAEALGLEPVAIALLASGEIPPTAEIFFGVLEEWNRIRLFFPVPNQPRPPAVPNDVEAAARLYEEVDEEERRQRSAFEARRHGQPTLAEATFSPASELGEDGAGALGDEVVAAYLECWLAAIAPPELARILSISEITLARIIDEIQPAPDWVRRHVAFIAREARAKNPDAPIPSEVLALHRARHGTTVGEARRALAGAEPDSRSQLGGTATLLDVLGDLTPARRVGEVNRVLSEWGAWLSRTASTSMGDNPFRVGAVELSRGVVDPEVLESVLRMPAGGADEDLVYWLGQIRDLARKRAELARDIADLQARPRSPDGDA